MRAAAAGKRRRLHRRLLFAGLLLAAWLIRSNFCLQTVTVEVESRCLPRNFDGFRILHISDLHGNALLYGQLLRSARAAGADLIAVTGDLADEEAQWGKLESLLRELCALAPVCYVTGNHEWAELDTELWLERLETLGVRVLRGDSLQLERDGEHISVLGADDPNGYREQPGPEDALARIPAGGYTLCLFHRPEVFPELAQLGCDLLLSGHNHGGLVRLPLLGGLFSPGGGLLPEYDGGLYALGDSRMLVSRGLSGVTGLPRVGNPPELPLIILRYREGWT